MKFKKMASSIIVSAMVILGSFNIAYADGSNVVTLGVNLTPTQKQQMLDYFGVNKDEVLTLDVTNAEERKYLQGVASEAQLGKATISCSYVEPTSNGGINVKTANLTWVTSSMIATTLSTAGLDNANVIAAAPYKVSGTGALTGIMKAFEDASGEKLNETKKELASEELVVTGNLGEEVGQEKATGVMNDIKSEIIKNGTSDVIQIADTINNITNNYNITLTPEQKKQIEDIMTKISKQDYDYSSMKNTLENVKDNVNQELNNIGEGNNEGFFTKIKDWFAGIFSGGSKNLGILNNTNDNALGSGAVIDATDKDVLNTSNNSSDNTDNSASNSSSDNNSNQSGDKNSENQNNDLENNSNDQSTENQDDGFLTKIINWVKGLF
ncbi:DUF1002 domain-containing protein [Clostridioides mangenotii]|uniref:DUF1002 domain-containing protein n=1 Tax=Metaclostridioides mangenotii TaxID=1540 RepID=UPI001C0FDD7B|nr:DUF1002 domain-containing protein [Clostridioides mangenotii]MBU5306387.1 DUF1002 domain-containing protein [Clostridioides mangenotii]MCR1953424.1 DUF1002 domain-containing protein [Clostridioides mangenotii]